MTDGRRMDEFGEPWLSQNPSQRYHLPRSALGRTAVSAHQIVKEIEPWGVLFAAFALILSLIVFALDYRDKIEERTVRAWQLVTTSAPGNSGKIKALEYLNKRDGLFCNDDACLVTQKERTSLRGIDLSVPQLEHGVILRDISLRKADLVSAKLRRVVLNNADLSGANLAGADFTEADLPDANLASTKLAGADFKGTDLSGANFAGADLTDTDLTKAILNGTDLLP